MQTYAETKGEQPINWWVRLEELRKIKEKLDSKDLDDDLDYMMMGIKPDSLSKREMEIYTESNKQAASWTTCACGNQCSIIPRNRVGAFSGAPKDDILRGLGTDFYSDVRSLDIDKALSTLEKIEQRSDELIREIRKEDDTNQVTGLFS
jgi:hypothetical protein